MPNKQCKTCNQKIIPDWKKSHGWTTRQYCSYECYWKSKIGKKLSEITRKKISEFRKNNPVSSIFKKGHPAPLTAFYKGQQPWNKGIEWPEMKGKNHPNWNGGISELVRKFNREKSKRWAYEIYKRDNWYCQNCGKKERLLHAHHIKSWKKYPKIRFDFDNGITLCMECHKKVHYSGLLLKETLSPII